MSNRVVTGTIGGWRWRRPDELRRLHALARVNRDISARTHFADGTWFYSFICGEETLDFVRTVTGLRPSTEEPEAADAVDPHADSTGTPTTRDT